MRRSFVLGAVSALVVSALVGCRGDSSPTGGSGGSDSSSGSKPTVAYVTNGIDPFWTVARAGVEAAGRDFDVNVEVRMPPDGVSDQKRMVQELLTLGVDGIAISPIDPDNQGDLLREIADHTKLITHDADAPNSPRLCYIGVDNYSAGRMCGELVKEAMPEGGSVIIFVGRLGQDNARLRRQGLIDELLDRDRDPTGAIDPPSTKLVGDKYTILDTRTDEFDVAKAKANAQDAIVRYPDLGCMVGLFAYNPPQCLAAVREADKIGKIKLVAFDEDKITLKGIQDGEVYGSIVQNPYKYGYESVRVLAGLARGDETVLPEGGYLDVPARTIKKDNVDAFWDELKKLTGVSENE